MDAHPTTGPTFPDEYYANETAKVNGVLPLLSITHKLCSDHETEFDFGQAGYASPHHHVAWRSVIGTGKMATKSGKLGEIGRQWSGPRSGLVNWHSRVESSFFSASCANAGSALFRQHSVIDGFADATRDVMLPEEIRPKLNPEQIKVMGAFAASMENRANSYSYDAQSRVTERHRSGGPFGDEVTITKYNDHGDTASERTTTVMNPEVGRVYSVTEAGTMIPDGPPQLVQPPTVFETQYSYQYDAYGNWTELTTASRSDPGAPFAPGSVRRRQLTYY
jgi:hypothetical protein